MKDHTWATLVALLFPGVKRRRKSTFRKALDTMITPGDTVNILQVGANDGVINDPLHQFLRSNPDRTQVILVEPQEDLIAPLTKAYAFHPRKAIAQVAVGPMGRMTLYRVRKACWPDLVLPYGKDWPDYRAPTGVTSGQRDTVLDWVRRYYRGSLVPESVIEKVEVDSVPTAALIQRAGLFTRLDVLQIDAEGCDDLVIRASDIAVLRPRLIHFEAEHLGATRFAALSQELSALGYRVEPQGFDCLARRRDQD